MNVLQSQQSNLCQLHSYRMHDANTEVEMLTHHTATSDIRLSVDKAGQWLQLQAMSRTDILLTPAGGTGTILMFLPPGATAIVMNYWDSVARKSVQMESIYYWNLEYLDMQYFPVLLEDYEQTTDRPRCEKPSDDPYYDSQVSRSNLVHACLNVTQSECQLSTVLSTLIEEFSLAKCRSCSHSLMAHVYCWSA